MMTLGTIEKRQNQAMHPSRRSASSLNHGFLAATWVIAVVSGLKNTWISKMKDATPDIPQYSLRSLFAVTLVIALIAATAVSLNRVFYRTPHEQAIDHVWGLDGSAKEDSDGHFAVVLCGNGIRVDDRICAEIAVCLEIQKLTIAQAQITDAGIKDVSELQNLFYLNLNGCTAVTDLSVPILGHLSGLRELYISDTGISQKGCDLLRKSLPNCTIHE
jgi:hypothetical protein